MSHASPEVTLAGHVCIDKNRISNGPVVQRWGSAVLYIANYFNNAHSITPHVIAPYGPDLRSHIQDLNIDINDPTQPETLIYKNISIGDTRTQSCENTHTTTPVPLDDHRRATIASSNIFITAPLTPDFPPEYSNEMMGYLNDSAITALGPQGYLRSIHKQNGAVSRRPFKEASKMLPHYTLVSISKEDCIDPYRTAEQWSDLAPKSTIVVTEGSRGARIFLKNKNYHVPTEAINAPDTNGCGDTFLGAMATGLFLGMDAQQATQYGHFAVHDMLLAAQATNMVQ